ncbi:flagellar biosynthesis protein FlhB [Sulfitobacter sp. M368]|uniref:EscU/YscU/HrcU family type III secretion system export apparatus switch protein n=1 Tax=Sulfitobacter sp. M368 TaxID=2867021 RepID=UPI0021A367B2|nr:flagellar type III secretion system protein FlhB [Sulfitobacter sp. M368]UWR15265.1 flagellar type III secretion system protein FlhB [Sulfitobacter sp. M368]
MSGQDEDTDKSFEPTPQKLLEARKKGDIAKSTDLMTAAAYAGLLLALLMTGSNGIKQAGTALMVLIDQAPQLTPMIFDGDASTTMAGLILPVIYGLSPLFLIPALAVAGSIAAQRALVFAPSKLKPKASRISIFSNAKNKFGRGGLFEFAKSFTKLCVYSVCLAMFIQARLPDMVSAVQTTPHLVLSLLAELCIAFLFVVVLIASTIGGIDAVWQHFEHLRKNRMSHKEITEETKNAEGDPHLKQERRQRAMAISQNQMMADVPTADVVIVNPTHFAVALAWSRKPGEAPVCVAKGVDEVAKSIRRIAAEAGVPIHSDPPTARSLHATVDIGQQIPPDLYRAVAAAIRFAEGLRERAKGRI